MDDDELLIEQIRSLYGKRTRIVWTQEKDDLVVEALRVHGMKWRAIGTELGMSDDTVRNRVIRWDAATVPEDIREMVTQMQTSRKTTKGKKRAKGAPYTTQEDDLIRLAMLSGTKWSQVQQDMLPSRTVHAIRNRAYRIAS